MWGCCAPPSRLPKTLRVTHRFTDTFTLIGSSGMPAEVGKLSRKARGEWMARQNWLMIDERTNTGQGLRRWMERNGCYVEPAMQLDNFDLLINLVALGMGVGFVPVRALALYNQRRKLIRIPLSFRFSREICVVVRKHRKMPSHIEEFIGSILF